MSIPQFVSVITGDIIKSRQNLSVSDWLKDLKTQLTSNTADDSMWDIYRGDSFQLESTAISDILTVALDIKAGMMMLQDLEVRMAIGVGYKTYQGQNISESQGSAMIRSGKLLETMGKKHLAIDSPWIDFDRQMNVMFEFVSYVTKRWTNKAARTFQMTWRNRDLSQKEIATILGLTQVTISESLKRSGYHELLALDHYFRSEISRYLADS